MKDALKILLDKKHIKNLDKYIEHNLDKYDNYQLIHILMNEGLKISDSMILYYNNVSGFRCVNLDSNIIGRNPNCNYIENILNEKIM